MPGEYTIEHEGRNPESDRMLLQKVYTGWLQYTLDNFIKIKVLKRFQLYRNQRFLNSLFKAWRY